MLTRNSRVKNIHYKNVKQTIRKVDLKILLCIKKFLETPSNLQQNLKASELVP
jgi:hypothetical protein